MADYDLQYQDTYIDVLLATANELKTAGYIYKGVATPSTNPGTPSERVAYLASEPGTYTNFGGIVIVSGLYSLTYASGIWTGTQMQAGSDIEVVQTTGDSATDVMSQKAVTDALEATSDLTKEYVDEKTDDYIQIGIEDAVIPAINVNKWTSATNVYNGRFVDVNVGDKLLIKANSSYYTSYAILSSRNYVLGGNVSFATGYTSAVKLLAGDLSDIIEVPNDGVVLYVFAMSNGDNHLPEYIKKKNIIREVVLFSDISNDVNEGGTNKPTSAEVAKNLNTKIDDVASVIAEKETANYDNIIFPAINVNKWTSATNVYNGKIVNVLAGQRYRIKGNKNSNSEYTILSSASYVLGGNVSFATDWGLETLDKDSSTAFFTIPSDGVAIWVSNIYNAVNKLPIVESASINPNRFEEIEDSIDTINEKIDNSDVERFILSEGLKEKMSHSAHVFYHKGVFYNYYMCGEVNTIESVNDPTEFLRLAKISSLRLDGNAQIEDLYKDGEGLGDFHQSPNYPVVIANAMMKDNVLFTYMRLRSSDNESVAILAYRRFNLNTNSWIDNVPAICKLDGNDFNGPNTANSYVSVGGSTPNTGNASNEISIIHASDGYYYQMIGVGSYGYGLLIRSSDLINWESVAVNQGLIDLFGEGGSFYSFENEIAELSNGVLAVACRVEGKGNIYYMTYDITNDEWSVPVVIPNTILTKPRMFHYNNKLYLNVNMNNSITTPGYGTQTRATLGIYEVSSDGVTLVKMIENKTGIHYTWTAIDFDGNLYLCFSEDRRYLNASQGRSDIGIMKLVI